MAPRTQRRDTSCEGFIPTLGDPRYDLRRAGRLLERSRANRSMALALPHMAVSKKCRDFDPLYLLRPGSWLSEGHGYIDNLALTNLLFGLEETHRSVLSAILDQSHDCIKLLDRDGNILFVNREGCRSMELSAPDEVVGQNWIDRWPDISREIVSDAWQSAQAGAVSRFNAVRPGPDGKNRWWDVTITPVADHSGARFLTIARDVSAEHREKERVAAINAEMRHRLKNAMTIAGGIVTLSVKPTPEHEPFAQLLNQRFSQLARVQEMALDPTTDKRLATFLPVLASAYGDITITGISDLPDAQLSDNAMQALALAFGELATNSLKYGALQDGAPVTVEGAVKDEQLHITWREPTVFGSPRPGSQGLGLVERLVRAVGGNTAREIAPTSLTVTVTVPVQS